MHIHRIARHLLPRPVFLTAKRLVNSSELLREFLIDFGRFERIDSGIDCPEERIEAHVTKLYHAIEKGLSLPSPRRPFGMGVRTDLLATLDRVGAEKESAKFVTCAYDAIAALDRWNEGGEVVDSVAHDGRAVTGNDVLGREAVTTFFATRRSVRNFSDHPPAIEDVIAAAELAGNTPSVCNRQAGRVHIYTDRTDIDAILSHQNGNRGFGHTIPVLAIVTVRRGLFIGVGERNQRWIDGGLFAMSLVWALHGLGLSSCMLNSSETNRVHDQLREVAGIPAQEDIIAMVGIGHAAEGFRVARSHRRAVDEVAITHTSHGGGAI